MRAEFVDPILSVMTTCGMYDFAGEWVYRVGMPAKSGVGGGIVAVLPGQLGIGVFSPALDERGNSVRGVAVCEALSNDLGLHFLHPPRPSVSTVRARYTLATVRSKRRRPANETHLLDEHGARAAVYELQGDLRFSTVERVVREIVDRGDALDFAVLDFKRVAHVDAPATRMLAALAQRCAAEGRHLVFTRVRRGELLGVVRFRARSASRPRGDAFSRSSISASSGANGNCSNVMPCVAPRQSLGGLAGASPLCGR